MSKVNPIYLSAYCILAIMFLLMIASAWNDSAIVDELAHVPAGFAYLYKQDYRLNPEHPPLLKTMAAVFGSAAKPFFPTEITAWRDDVNGQWDYGAIFLYESGNDADKIIFWSRVPFMLLALFFGWLIFTWTRKRFGDSAALMTLIFFAFSPTFLTHSRYVTTDLGAAFGFFIGLISFLKFLDSPGKKNVLIAGTVFGIAELLKFSLVLLVPLYVMLAVFWVLTSPKIHPHDRLRYGLKIFLKLLAIFAIGMILVWIVYSFHVWNYPIERQYRDTEFLLSSYGTRPLADMVVSMTQYPILKPLAQYLLGILMVNQRATGGNTQFFLGEISAAGFPLYFPILYLLKEPLALHLMTLIALWTTSLKVLRSGATNFIQRIRLWIGNNFFEFSALAFIAVYWVLSVSSPLNIGVRHVLPTFPFIYILIARTLARWIEGKQMPAPENWREALKNLYEAYIKLLPRYTITGFLFCWLILQTLFNFPHFMTYYNELAGGAGTGWRVAVDSNYDWGQDLKRLKAFTEKNKIEKIAIDYFGGGQPKYYFGETFEPWYSSKGPASGWFAISATFRQGTFGVPVAGFVRKPEDSYEWLKPYSPVVRIGSIFVYRLP